MLVCRCNNIRLSDIIKDPSLECSVGDRCGICLTQTSIDIGLTDIIIDRNLHVKPEENSQ